MQKYGAKERSKSPHSGGSLPADIIHKDIEEIRKELNNMEFTVVCGNPPYQLETAGAGRQAKPIYNLFVEQAKKLNPKYLTMIIPSRWFSGGMGLESFRNTMMNDRHIIKIVDYTNAKECFPGNSISGGVCFFLRDRDKEEDCTFVNVTNGVESVAIRPLNEFQTLVRYNQSVSIIRKIQSYHEKCIDTIISGLMPYGLPTNYRGHRTQQKGDLTLYASDGITYIENTEIVQGKDTVDKYKVLMSKCSAEHAGEPDKDGKFRVIPSSMKVLAPSEVCTHSYFILGHYDNELEAKNLESYLKTKLVRFLMLLCVSGFSLSKLTFQFVPMQDFSKPWTDAELYRKYGLTQEEIDFIESMIKPME